MDESKQLTNSLHDVLLIRAKKVSNWFWRDPEIPQH